MVPGGDRHEGLPSPPSEVMSQPHWFVTYLLGLGQGHHLAYQEVVGRAAGEVEVEGGGGGRRDGRPLPKADEN